MLSSTERPVLVSEYAHLATLVEGPRRLGCHFGTLRGWRHSGQRGARQGEGSARWGALGGSVASGHCRLGSGAVPATYHRAFTPTGARPSTRTSGARRFDVRPRRARFSFVSRQPRSDLLSDLFLGRSQWPRRCLGAELTRAALACAMAVGAGGAIGCLRTRLTYP